MILEQSAAPAAAASRANRRPIADYALIGDMRGSALVASDATIDWLCLSRFDADPVFAGLLDSGIGGSCSVTLEGGVTHTSRRYRHGTNILETTLHGRHGTVLVSDCMPVRQIPDIGDVGADSVAAERLLRCIRCIEGSVVVRLRIAPCFDWGSKAVAPVAAGRLASYPGENLHIACSHAMLAQGEALLSRAELSQGHTMVLMIGQADLGVDSLDDADRQYEETAHYWKDWQRNCTYQGVDADAVARSSLCLKLLIHAPTGGMVAAPTAGLPESPGGVRNWDYRFVWTRDASFCVSAFLTLGHRREAAEFLRFMHGSCHGGDAVRVMYAVQGPVPPERLLPHLAGWEGSTPVRIGNAAIDQKQHEIYGELMDALFLYLDKHGTGGLCPALVRDLPDFVVRLADAAIERYPTPDQGIWELRGPGRHLLHSKAMCWVAVDRAIRLAPYIGLAIPGHWVAARESMYADCMTQGWSDAEQAFTMEFGGSQLDMSVLRLVLMKMIDADDPRMVSTLAALKRDLSDGDLYYRYRFDDGLPGADAAFVACSFWVTGVLARRGERDAARAMMDRLLQRSNDLGLMAEQIDPATGAHLGNFPQAFSHMSLIYQAITLGSDSESPA